jgi:hypothetical protein
MRLIRWMSLLAIVGACVIGLLAFNLSAAQAAPLAQQGTGQICVLAFSDTNGDGVYTAPDEPLLAGVNFKLVNEAGKLQNYPTDGSSEPYCFGNLAVGQYTVQARPDAKQVKGEATTPGQWVVPLAAGAQYDISYGVQEGSQPVDTAASSSGSGGSGSMSTLGRIVVGLLGVAMFGAAALLAYSIIGRARSA